MSKFKLWFSAMAAAVMLTACGTDDPAKEHLVDTFDNYFAYDVQINNGTAETNGRIATVGTITVDFDDDNKKATIAIKGLTYGTENNYSTVDQIMRDLPYVADEHGVRTMAVNSVNGDRVEGVDVERIDLVYYPDATVNDSIYHGLAIRLRIGKSDITLMPREAVGVGTTTTTTIRTGSTFVSTSTVYRTSVNIAERTIQLYIDKPAFAENMPTLGTMDFNSHKVTLRSGGYALDVPELIPSIDGIPYPRYSITGLSLDCDVMDNELDVEFQCMGAFKVDAEVSGCYTVQHNPVTKK